jgi:hypothetical protein
MKTLQQQDINAVSGGCFQTEDGEYFDIILVDPNSGMYMPVPCMHLHASDPLPPAPREPKPRPGQMYP